MLVPAFQNKDTCEAEKRKQSRRFFFVLLIILTGLFFLLNISMGTVKVSLADVIKIILGQDINNAVHHSIVTNIRLPRALAAIIGGACLGISGLLLQVFFDNPIVEPYVLGISSGASLFVGLTVLGGYTFGLAHVSPLFLFLGAFIGAMLVMMVIIFAARKVKSITTLLIVGIMAGFICSAFTAIMTAFADNENIAGFLMWTMGSFSGFSWDQVKYLYVLALPCIFVAMMMAKPLNSLLFGESYARSMGLNINLFRIVIVCLSSILTASVTAFAGPVSFVGLAVPHMARVMLGTGNSRLLLPAVILGGALMVSACDLGCRLLMSPAELPLSAMTSLVGGPLVVYLLLTKESGL